MSQYHEPANELSGPARDITRALVSLKEEIEAIDWYNQRIDRTENAELKQILAHNRDEEIEHACMALGWLRKNMDAWDENLKTYVFKDGNNTEQERGGEESESRSRDLGIGKIK